MPKDQDLKILRAFGAAQAGNQGTESSKEQGEEEQHRRILRMSLVRARIGLSDPYRPDSRVSRGRITRLGFVNPSLIHEDARGGVRIDSAFVSPFRRLEPAAIEEGSLTATLAHARRIGDRWVRHALLRPSQAGAGGAD